MHTSLRVRSAIKRASLILSATPEDQKKIRDIHHRDSILMADTGTNPAAIKQNPHSWNQKQPLRLIWSGLFLGRKALPVALWALNMLPNRNMVELHILGDGAEKNGWTQLAHKLDVAQQCNFYGMVPHKQALEITSSCDCMIFTSFQEATSTVIMEALTYGLPVICHDTCGMASIIDNTCGFKIPVISPKESARRFNMSIQRLLDNPSLVLSLSKGALIKAQEHNWDNKACKMTSFYQDILLSRQNNLDSLSKKQKYNS